MRKITLLEHVSADGFAAGPNGEINWIKLDNEMFDFIGTITANSDAALYGRITYQMMESYWPTAADKPNATKHDIEHSQWYNNVEKFVLSNTLNDAVKKTLFIRSNIFNELVNLKNRPGKDILMIGSPGAAKSLMEYNLIDNYYLFFNPVILGSGIQLFGKIKDKIQLKLLSSKAYSSGVAVLHYAVIR